MKTLLKVLLVLSLAAWPSLLLADVTIYANQATWAAAVGGPYLVEDFNDPTLIPGLTITSVSPWFTIPYNETNYAFARQKVMRDQVNEANNQWTVFTFAIPIYAFGGFFDLAGPTGPGTNITVSVGGTVLTNAILNSTYGTFWGMVSTTPFSSVTFSEGTACCVETYDLENLSVAPVPEPGTISLIGVGVAALLLARFRRRR